MTTTRTMLLVILAVAAPALMSCGCRGGSDRIPAVSPQEGFDTFLMALENGDADTAIQLVVKAQRQTFSQVLSPLSRDDVIATGLQFRQEAYRLDETTDRLAIFWSDSAKLYLVLAHEDDMWRLDPGLTDEMNADTTD